MASYFMTGICSVADLECSSRIQIFINPGSRIPQQQKRGGGKKSCFTQKLSKSYQIYVLGIRDPRAVIRKKPIPIPDRNTGHFVSEPISYRKERRVPYTNYRNRRKDAELYCLKYRTAWDKMYKNGVRDEEEEGLVSDESKKGQKGGEEMDMATQC
jgi:hypothetical protein